MARLELSRCCIYIVVHMQILAHIGLALAATCGEGASKLRPTQDGLQQTATPARFTPSCQSHRANRMLGNGLGECCCNAPPDLAQDWQDADRVEHDSQDFRRQAGVTVNLQTYKFTGISLVLTAEAMLPDTMTRHCSWEQYHRFEPDCPELFVRRQSVLSRTAYLENVLHR